MSGGYGHHPWMRDDSYINGAYNGDLDFVVVGHVYPKVSHGPVIETGRGDVVARMAAGFEGQPIGSTGT